MLEKFQNHIEQNLPFLLESKVFIAVSGGVDSMVLVDLFQKLNFPFTILHCNFKLRGEESENETQFIRDFGRQNNIRYIIRYFDTEKYAQKHKLSIQVAARELRYQWFQQEINENEWLLTAHHADDNLETFLINLSRGTGIEGLTGIPEQNNFIVRPLLPFSRNEIITYAQSNKVEWKDDSSNASIKYLRNKIRHQIVPLLKELHPTFLENFEKTQQLLQINQQFVEKVATELYPQFVKKEGEITYFDILKLKERNYWKMLLYQWLKPFGFSAWSDIYDLISSQSGKAIHSPTHILLKNRDELLLYSKEERNKKSYFVSKLPQTLKVPLKLKMERNKYSANFNRNTIFVDEEAIQFPLEIRKWEQGDVFYPSGMKGKKKLSKYFKDEKYSIYDKENQWLLVSNNQIVWIIGKRADSRFIANENTQHIIKIEVQE